MLSQVPGSQDDPLFFICGQGTWFPLTDSIDRKHLKRISSILGWEHKQVTFHTFSRSGASWAFQHGILIEAIKKVQGSDCVRGYIHTTSNPVSDPLLQAFKLHLPH